MAAAFSVYALPLPSGCWVHVRPLDTRALFASNHTLFPLLAAAAAKFPQPPSDDEAEESNQGEDRSGPFFLMQRTCEACLVAPTMPGDIQFEEIWFEDAMTIYRWALSDPTSGNARRIRRQRWSAGHFLPLVQGQNALMLDMVCRRYRALPSRVLGMERSPFATDLDLAIAYRANTSEAKQMRRSRRRTTDDGYTVSRDHGDFREVEDQWGGKHQVPASYLADSMIPPDAKVVNADALSNVYGEMRLGDQGMKPGLQ